MKNATVYNMQCSKESRACMKLSNPQVWNFRNHFSVNSTPHSMRINRFISPSSLLCYLYWRRRACGAHRRAYHPDVVPISPWSMWRTSMSRTLCGHPWSTLKKKEEKKKIQIKYSEFCTSILIKCSEKALAQNFSHICYLFFSLLEKQQLTANIFFHLRKQKFWQLFSDVISDFQCHCKFNKQILQSIWNQNWSIYLLNTHYWSYCEQFIITYYSKFL